MVKILSIEKVFKSNQKVRLYVKIERDGADYSLWFEFSDIYDAWIETSNCDGVLLALLPYCLKRGYGVFSQVPATRDVLQNLESMISLMAQENSSEYKSFAIEAPIVETCEKKIGKAILSSGSCGVDALHTLWASERSRYFKQPTHLIFNNTGSSHTGRNQSVESQSALIRGRVKNTSEFAERYGYGYIFVDSNYKEFIGDMHYGLTNTFINIAIGYFLSRGVEAYYLSSGFEVSQISFGSDPAHAEPVLANMLCSSYLKVTHVANDFCSRFEKLKHLIRYEPAVKCLNTCLYEVENCGVCPKCRRVLMGVECIGSGWFDTFNFKRYQNERNEIFARIIIDHWNKDVFVDEMWPFFATKLTLRHWCRAACIELRNKIISTRIFEVLNKIRHRILDKRIKDNDENRNHK